MKAAALVALALVGTGEAGDVLGYLENWVDVKWWDNNIPGNCLMGCFNPQPYLAAIEPYSSMNYGFTFLTENPSPDQVLCDNAPNSSGSAAGPCPAWDGKAIYLAQSSKQGAVAITPTTSAVTPGIVAIMDAGRMAKMHPSGPKRFKISLGGWSDFARIGTTANGEAIGKLAAQLVGWTFADGIDLDFEHLTPYATISGDDEFAAYTAMVKALRSELDGPVKSAWVSTANSRAAELQKEFDALQPWQQGNAKNYYNTTIAYLKEVAQNGPPQFEVSWTTRFNAFLPPGNRWNYLLPDSQPLNDTFATDYEGDKVWPALKDAFDTVNIMAYDAGPIGLNFTTILENFVTYGKVPKEKILIGFEPGEQAAGGIWEGRDADKEWASWAHSNGYAGAFVWAVNPSSTTNPKGTQLCPEVAKDLNSIMQPKWRWGKEPTYTKCDPSTGWNPNF